MSTVEIFAVLSRWVHLLAMATAIGGIIFYRKVLLPAQHGLDPQTIEQIQAKVKNSWRKLFHSAIGLLVITGFINLHFAVADKPTSSYYSLFTVKLLLVFALIVIATLLLSKRGMPKWIENSQSRWQTLVLLLAITIVAISGLLKLWPRG